MIAAELYRNIGLAIAAVSLTTLFLLSDLVASFLVLGRRFNRLIGLARLRELVRYF